jgi:hypothetical protein
VVSEWAYVRNEVRAESPDGGSVRRLDCTVMRKPSSNLGIEQKGDGSVGTAQMSEHDRLDRMERKLNRIGKYVLLGIGLFAMLLLLQMQNLANDVFFGYGRVAIWSFVAVTAIVLLIARAPFRD